MARKRSKRDWARWEHYQNTGKWPKNPNASRAQAAATPAQRPVAEKKPVNPTPEQPTLFDLAPEPPKPPRYYGALD